jgi:ribonuclease HI
MPFRAYPSGMKKSAAIPQQELFGSPPDDAPEKFLVAHIDGGARGNPGPAGYGVLIEDEKQRPVAQLSEYLGRQTNNFAEYSAWLAALRYALDPGYKAIEILSDSELLVKQIKGEYQVSSENLKPLYEQARALIRQMDWFNIRHVRREQNKKADALANAAMDRGAEPRAAGDRSG